MNATPEQRIAALENEVRGLKNLLGAQKRTPNRPEALTPPPRRDEPQVRVTSPPLAKSGAAERKMNMRACLKLF